MRFSTENLRQVFAEENKYENFRYVASNLVRGNEIFERDENGNEIRVTKRDANRAIRNVFMDVCGLDEDSLKSRKTRERAERLHNVEIFEIIEEDIEFKINEGFQASEWFEQFVERKNLKLGDDNIFYIDRQINQYLVVGKYSGDHHDVTMQQLAGEESFTVSYGNHVVKIGKDIDLVILGRYDYDKLVTKIAEAFLKDIQDAVFADTYAAADKLPASMKKSGALSSATKANFDELIENVEIANGTEVVIMGTKNALKKITGLADVDWATVQQKEDIALNGRLGTYEGTTLMEIPQRLKINSATFEKLIPNNKLLIMPVTTDKFIKLVDVGEVEIREVTNKGDLKDDFQTHEVCREYGHEIVLGQYFGEWTLE